MPGCSRRWNEGRLGGAVETGEARLTEVCPDGGMATGGARVHDLHVPFPREKADSVAGVQSVSNRPVTESTGRAGMCPLSHEEPGAPG